MKYTLFCVNYNFYVFPVSIEAARAYQERRRNFPPALYNDSPRRLRANSAELGAEPRAGPSAVQNAFTFFRRHSFSSGILNVDLNN